MRGRSLLPLATLPFGRFFFLLPRPNWFPPWHLRCDLLVVISGRRLTDNVVNLYKGEERGPNAKLSPLVCIQVTGSISVPCWASLPVRMFWNAVSTFVESRADVSMNDSVFFSGEKVQQSRRERERGRQTCVDFGLLGGDSSEVAEITFVANQHDDNVCVGMVTELFQPSLNVLISQVFSNVVDQQCAHSSAIITVEICSDTFSLYLLLTTRWSCLACQILKLLKQHHIINSHLRQCVN